MNNFNLKPVFLLALLFGSLLQAHAQSINNYVFSTNTTSSLNRSIGSLVDDIDLNSGFEVQIGGSINNQSGLLDTIPFDFWIGGARVTRFNTTSNGWIGLTNAIATGTVFGSNAGAPRLAPFLTSSGNSGMGTSQNGKIQTKVFGSQPNRIFVIEYVNMAINFNGASNDSNTMQVRLYENNGTIEYVYGRMANLLALGMNYQVGFQLAATFPSVAFQHINTTTQTSSTSVSTANTAPVGDITPLVGRTPGAQRAYVWTPTPVSDPGVINISAITTSAMTLTWTNVANEIGYAVYRSTNGGASYELFGTTVANVATFNATGLIANTTYDWRVYAIRESVSAPSDAQATTLPATKFFTTAGGNWSDPNIWNTLAVPSSQDSAEITTGHVVTLDLATQQCGTLIVNGTLNYWATSAQQTLTVNGDVIVNTGGVFDAGTGTGLATAPHILNIGGNTAASNWQGNLIVNGTFDMQTTAHVQTVFFGTQNGTISGTGPVCDMPLITVTKGGVAPFNVNNTLEILRVITQASTASPYFVNTFQRFVATSGTLKISAAVVVNSMHMAQLTFATAIGARFWLNHPSAALGIVAGGNSQINLNGELRIDNGAITVGAGSLTHFINTNGVLNLNGGVLTLNGAMSTVSVATCQVNINNGRLIIDPQATASSFATALTIQSLTTFSMTGGSIEINDPAASTNNSTSISIIAGGVKSITGGTIIIGSGLTAPTGFSPLGSGSGFGLSIAIPIFNLTLNNNISVNNTRMCRLMANLTVNGNLTLDPSAYLYTGSGGTGFALEVKGNIINNGTISGQYPTITGPNGVGSLSLTGTGLQTISGSGNTALLSLRIANAAGANFSNTGVWALERVTLEQGNVTNTTANIQIGATTYRGNVIIGGLNESTLSGSFSSLPTFINTFGFANYTYGPSASSLQTGSFNEMPSGPQDVNNLIINDGQGVIANRNLIVRATLTLTAGNLNIGTNSLTVGTSTGAPGSLVRTAGFVQMATNGSFTRWYQAFASPAFDYASGFPLSTGFSERSVLLSLGGGFLAGGGNLTVKHTNTVGFTDITAFTDNAVSVDRRSNSFWNISTSSNPNVGANTLTLRLVGGGIGAVSDFTQLRMIRSVSAAGGTSVDGTGSNILPAVNRSFVAAEITGGQLYQDFYFGANSGVNPLSPTIIAIATGNWNETATWEGGIIPTITNSASVATGVTVTIPTGYTATCNGLNINSGGTLAASAGSLNSAGSITIDGTMNASGSTVNVVSTATNGMRVNTGGTFTLSNGTVNIGTTGGGNNRFTDSGSVTISGGTLNINGNMVIGESAVFNQSAGDINIDGNSGLAASSTAAGAHLLHIKSNALNCSGGTITIVDPPHNSLGATSTNAVRMQVSLGTLTGFTGSHTLRLGDGTSTETGNANGFNINTRGGTSIITLNNVTVNGGSATGRWTSSSFTPGNGTHIKGSMLITNGSEFRNIANVPFALGGDLTNNGTFTSQQTVIFGGSGYPVVNAQAISGTGTFRNNTSSPTGEFVNLTVDNGTGLTLNTTNVTYRITTLLTIGANNVTTNTNTIVVSNTGLSRTTGYIVGNLGKTFTLGSISRTFEIGSATNYLPVTATFPNVTTIGNVVVGINTGDHPQLGSSCINPSKSVNRYWNITNNGTVSTGGNYTFNFLAGDVDGGTVLGSAKLFSYDGSAWQAGLTPFSTSSTTYVVNSLNNYGAVAIGEITPVPTTVSITASSNNICIGTNVSCTATVVNGGPSPTYQWKVNGSNVVGANSNIFSSTALSNNDAITCETVSNSPCVVAPNATSNTINMTVAPLTIAGAVNSGTSTICSGSNSGVLTLSGHTGSIVRWESSASPLFGTITTINNTTNTHTALALTASTYFRAVVKSGECSELASTAFLVNVDPPSDAKTITGNNAICAGASVGNLQLAAGTVGNVLKWMVTDVPPYTTFNDIANTTTTQAGGSPTVTTHYKAIVQNGTCEADTTPVFIITVTPATVGGSVSGSQTICVGGTPTQLTLGGGFVGAVQKWQSATDAAFTTGLVELTAVTTTTYTPPSPSVTTHYRAVVQSGSCTPANSVHATVTVNPAPVAGSIGGTDSVCTGTSPGTLTLTGHSVSASLQWITSTSSTGPWIAVGNTTPTYNPGILTATRSYRVVASVGSCVDDTTAAFTVTVSPTTAPGNVSGTQTICAGGSPTQLTLSSFVGTIQKWQSATNSTFSAGLVELTAITTATYTPPAPSVTTFYRAVVKSGVCAVDNSVHATITVNPASNGGGVSSDQTLCSGGSPTVLTLTGFVGTIQKWQSATDLGFTTGLVELTAITTDTFTPPASGVSTYYRAVVQSGSCLAASSTPALISITAASAGGNVSGDQTICTGGTPTQLTLSSFVGTIQKWQSATNAAFTVGLVELTAVTTATYTPPAPSVTTFYRAVVQSGSCAAANSGHATITVNPASNGGDVSSNQTLCSGGSPAQLTLTGFVGTIQKWQSATDLGFTTGLVELTAITTATYTPPAPGVSTYYRAVVQSGSCLAANSTPALITITAASAGGSVTGDHTICTGGSPTQLTLGSFVGTIQKWQSATNAAFTVGLVELTAITTATYTPPAPSVTTFYRAVVQSGSCAADNSGHATITVNPASNGGTITGSTPVCSGGSTNLNLGGSVGTINKWQFADNAPLFNNWTDIANSTASYTTPSLTQTHRYRAQVTSGSCTPAFSNEFEVTVTSTGIWVGVFNANWDNPLNWCGGVPVAATNVTIPSGTPFSPSINTASAVANNVTVDLGATLNFSGTTNVISIAGNLVVNGTFTTTNGTVTLNGATAQNVSAIPFNRLRILGGGTKTLTGSGNATITGDLELTSGNVEVGSANLVINGATITGGGSSSFVTTGGTGNFVYNNLGSSNIIYHMGAGGSYTPITIANNGTVDNIAVKMLGDVYTSYVGESGSGAISANVVNRTYIFNEAVAGGSSLNVTFQWNGTNELSMNRGQTIIGKFNGGVWSQQAGPINISGSGPTYNVSLNGITSLGIFGIGDVNSPLPVKLVSFTAKLADGVSKLKWTTASEINSTHFDVERGTDGYNFTPIGKVKASGNTSTRVDYKFDDAKVGEIINNGDIAYYRLKFVNMNGKYEYSSVISVSSYVNMVFDVVSTVPNPFKAQTQVTFKTSSTSDVTVEVTDAFGKIVTSSVVIPVTGSNKLDIGTNNAWKAGVYFVKITQDDNTKVIKIIRE